VTTGLKKINGNFTETNKNDNNLTRLLLILSVLTALSLSLAPPDNYVTIKFDRLELLKNGWGGRQFYFKVNGTAFSPDDKTHRIKINAKPLDNFIFSFDSTFKDAETCLTRFKTGQTYKIRINPCSQYELVADSNAKTGQVRFKTINNKDTLIAGIFDGYTPDTLIKNGLTNYLQNTPSAMCYFAPIQIYFTDKEKDGSVTTDDKKIRAKTSFHFLQGEMLTATYDGKTKKITVTVDGYAK